MKPGAEAPGDSSRAPTILATSTLAAMKPGAEAPGDDAAASPDASPSITPQ